MNFEKRLEKLAALANTEHSPQVNIAPAVLAAISHQAPRRDTASERQLMWFAVISSAVAATVVVAAIAAYYNLADPITEVSQTISWVIQ